MKIPGKRYWCGVDICTEGIQFCYRVVQQRCRYCSDFADDCFTNLQQQNCTQYCMDRWFEEHSLAKPEQGEFTTTAVIALSLLCVAVIVIVMQCYSKKVKYYGKRVMEHIRSKCCSTTGECTSRDNYISVSAIEDNREEAEGIENDANRRRGRSCNGAVPNGNNESNRLTNVNGSIRQNSEAICNGNVRGNSNNEDSPVLEVDLETGNGVPVAQDTTQASVYSNHCYSITNRQSISGSSAFHDSAHNVQNAPHISATHNYENIQSPRCELSSPVSSDGPLAIGYRSPGLDTGYNSTNEDLDRTHLKESRSDRHNETEGNTNQTVYRSQQRDDGPPVNSTLAPISTRNDFTNEAQSEDGRIEPVSCNSSDLNTLLPPDDLQRFAANNL